MLSATSAAPAGGLFPPLEPYATGRLPVGDGHELHFEELGRRDGIPVVFLHGGPGSGISVEHRRFFDPGRFRVVLFDQRGAGRSTPLTSHKVGRRSVMWDHWSRRPVWFERGQWKMKGTECPPAWVLIL